jgi:hypothetical protein
MAIFRLDRKRTYGDGTANELKSIKPLKKMDTGSYAAEVLWWGGYHPLAWTD